MVVGVVDRIIETMRDRDNSATSRKGRGERVNTSNSNNTKVVVVVEEEEIMVAAVVVVVAVGVAPRVATFSKLEIIQTKPFKRQQEQLWNTVWIWIQLPPRWTLTLQLPRLVVVPA